VASISSGLPERHLERTLGFCYMEVPFGMVEAIQGDTRAKVRRGEIRCDQEPPFLTIQQFALGGRQIKIAWVRRHSNVPGKNGPSCGPPQEAKGRPPGAN